MTWFYVDDNLAFHRKVVAAGNAAMGLWVRAGSWSCQQLTDGHVPDHMVAVLGTPSQARRLVAVGLWVAVQGGFQFHQWAGEGRQRTRDQVLTERAYNARRTALHRDPTLTAAIRKRDAGRCRYCGALVAWNDRRSALGGTYDHVDPDGPNTLENLVVACRGCNSKKTNRPLARSGMTLLAPGSFGKPAGQATSYLEQNQNEPSSVLDPYRPPPQPTPPLIEEEQQKTPSSVGGRSRKRPATRLPDDWKPNERHTQQARDLDADLAFQAEQFRNHAEANDRRQASWDAAFRQWLNNAPKFRRAPLRLASSGGNPEIGFWEQ